MRKDYVLDAKILIQSPTALYGFDDNAVHITHETIQELSHALNNAAEKDNAKKVLNMIRSIINNRIQSQYSINDRGGTLSVHKGIPHTGKYTYEDLLLREIKSFHERSYILITNRPQLSIMASANGILSESYRNEQTILDQTYKGWRDLVLPSDIIDALYDTGEMGIDCISDAVGNYNENSSSFFHYENEYYRITCGNNQELLAIFQKGRLKKIDRFKQVYGIKPKSFKQAFLLHALMLPASEVPLVIVRGPAGTGKTICALAAGLEMSLVANDYGNILISRNNILTEKGFGAVPGDLDDKMRELLNPFYDALEALMIIHEGGKWEKVKEKMRKIFEHGIIDICAFSYIRGRNFANRYFILDEAQNTSRGKIRDLITRPSHGTKLVILGDISQIDAPDLDEYTSGLTYCAEHMKGSPYCAQIVFDQKDCIRSPLAQEALQRLTT